MTMSLAEKELDSEFDSKFVGSLSTVDLAPLEITAVRKGGRCLNDVNTGIRGGMQRLREFASANLAKLLGDLSGW